MTFDLGARLPRPYQRQLYRLLAPAIEGPLGLRGLETIYRRAVDLHAAHPQGRDCRTWFESVLTAMDAAGDIEEPADFDFPRSGPLVVVANHPFGILDPVILAHYAACRRPDVKVMK